MERRKFLNLGLVAAAAALAPMTNLSAANFRETKAKAWTIEKSADAITEMFGAGELKSGDG